MKLALLGVTVVALWTMVVPGLASTQSPQPSEDSIVGTGGFSNKWRPYADTSPFNTPIPAGPVVVANSQRIVDKMLTVSSEPAPILAGLSSQDDYAHPTYYAKNTDPAYTIDCRPPWGGECPIGIEGATIHLPAGARPTTSSDGHLGVVNLDSGVEHDFWQAQDPPDTGGTLIASYGSSEPIGGGGVSDVGNATAAEFALLAGIIRAEELEAGEIRHALFLVTPCGAQSPAYVPPATKEGKACPDNTDRPPMGARFQLNMTRAEIDALPVPAWRKVILRALATYGAYFGDTGGSHSFGLQIESALTYTSFGQPDKLLAFAAANEWRAGSGDVLVGDLTGVDWRRLRIVAP